MKKKIDKKGFTLIELLAVIVLMLAISVMAISSISAAIERNKAKQNEAKIEIIIGYAKLFYEENKNTYGKKDTGCISLEDNLELTDNEAKDANGNSFKGGVYYYYNAEEDKIKFEYPSDNCK